MTRNMNRMATVKMELEMSFMDEALLLEMELKAELEAMELEEIALYEHDLEIERMLLEWLATADRNDPEYSDIYKDVYGVRPRW